MLVRLIVSPSSFTMETHRQSFPGNNPVSYHGSAIFYPEYKGESQRFVFYMMSPNSACNVKLIVGGKPVIDTRTISPNQVAAGGAEFDKPPFGIQFVSACTRNSATINIKVRGPNDMAPRDFRRDELYVSRN